MEPSSCLFEFHGGRRIRSYSNTIRKIMTPKKRTAHFDLALISLILSSIPGNERKRGWIIGTSAGGTSGCIEEARMDTPLEMGSAIKLEDAYFCLNCETVTNYLDICPLCGERRLWSLQNWLGRINGSENKQDRGLPHPAFQAAGALKRAKTHPGEMIAKSLLAWRKKLLCPG
jgi:hypothetical protein